MDDSYEPLPWSTLKRQDGSTIRFYRNKTDPCCFLPIQDDGTVVNWVERFSTVEKQKVEK